MKSGREGRGSVDVQPRSAAAGGLALTATLGADGPESMLRERG
jgi:hypothetical protein